jgi:hypothetical protein
MEKTPLPRHTWRILSLSAVLLLLATVLAIGFISAGFFDPQPVGSLAAEIPLTAQSVPALGQSLTWLNHPLSDGGYSLHLTAAHQSGETDISYGLALGNEEAALVIAVSPLGYIAIHQRHVPISLAQDNLDNMIANNPNLATTVPFSLTDLLPFQRWPHTNPGQAANEIWLDKQGDTITIRLNRELLWQGSFPLSPAARPGLWLASFNDQTTVEFQLLLIYTNSPLD